MCGQILMAVEERGRQPMIALAVVERVVQMAQCHQCRNKVGKYITDYSSENVCKYVMLLCKQAFY